MILHPAKWINPEKRAKGPPPQTLFAFIKWCLNGTFAVLTLAAIASIMSGIVEILGRHQRKLILALLHQRKLILLLSSGL